MKAAVYYENGGPDVFRYEDVPDPECHRKGIVVLVQAGASGVGVAAIQLAARAGAAMVLATASSDERLEKLKPLGLTHGINYREKDVVQEVARLTDKHMCDVIVDSVGGPTLQSS